LNTAQYRDALRREFDAAAQDLIKMRPGDGACISTANLTSAFYAAIGESVFEPKVSQEP
jgi:hypothetical protein